MSHSWKSSHVRVIFCPSELLRLFFLKMNDCVIITWRHPEPGPGLCDGFFNEMWELLFQKWRWIVFIKSKLKRKTESCGYVTGANVYPLLYVINQIDESCLHSPKPVIKNQNHCTNIWKDAPVWYVSAVIALLVADLSGSYFRHSWFLK